VRPPSLKAADFQKALGSRPAARTAHFVLHALPHSTGNDVAVASAAHPLPAELSTSDVAAEEGLVDDFVESLSPTGSQPLVVWRLGLVLPKKQAKRSVTRSLIRHQAREALHRHSAAVLADGRHHVDGWVLRLRAPFDRQQFPSAASDALKAAVRQELDELWLRLIAPSSKGGRMSPGLPGASKSGDRTSRGAA
jgi:ribonuclease P protein component